MRWPAVDAQDEGFAIEEVPTDCCTEVGRFAVTIATSAVSQNRSGIEA